jgi:predicted Zn-dependent protease
MVERLLARVRLGDEQVVGVDAQRLGVRGVHRVLGVDVGGLAAGLLEQGRAGEAVLYLEEQLRLLPSDSVSRKMLSDLEGGKPFTNGERARFHRDLAREFAQRGEREKAAWHFRKALGYETNSKATPVRVPK